MIAKKINKLLYSVFGIALTIGIMNTPVFAADNVQATSVNNTNVNLIENNNYIVNKDNSIEKNGLTISIDKVVASKHKLKTTVIIKNQKPFDIPRDQKPLEVLLSYGDNKFNSQGESPRYKDDKTLVITIERTIYDEELPEKGPLRIDILIPQYKINVGLDANVDFSEAFKNSSEKDVSINIPEINYTINKVESNDFGTQITCSQPEKDLSNRKSGLFGPLSSELILKAGDNMYPIKGANGYSSRGGKNDRLMMAVYDAEAATYDKVKNQDKISLIPVVCTMTSDEIEKFYKDNYKIKDKKNEETNKETTSNVSYTKEFDFSDGSKGEIYNIERNDNNLKIYCKGATEKESLLMAGSMSIHYKYEEGKEDDSYYDGNKNVVFYKDSKEALGYIVEFNDVQNDKTVEIGYNNLMKQIDKFKIGDEIQIAK